MGDGETVQDGIIARSEAKVRTGPIALRLAPGQTVAGVRLYHPGHDHRAHKDQG